MVREDIEDLTGRRFGRLVVLNREKNDKHGKTRWRCKCDCGTIKTIGRRELIRGDTKSCGCYWRERTIERNKRTKKTHGFTGTRIQKIWRNMIRRCEKPDCQYYSNYGGRGIKVCEEWHDLKAFAEWAYKHGFDDTLPKWECTIERKDVNGDYEPSNCYFTNMFEQNSNRRTTVKVKYNGEDVPLMKLCRDMNINRTKAYNRIRKGNTIEEIIEELTNKGETYQPYG